MVGVPETIQHWAQKKGNMIIWLTEPTRVNFWLTIYMTWRQLKDPYQTHRDFDPYEAAITLHLQYLKLLLDLITLGFNLLVSIQCVWMCRYHLKDVRAKIFYMIDFFLNLYYGQIMIYLFQKWNKNWGSPSSFERYGVWKTSVILIKWCA